MQRLNLSIRVQQPQRGNQVITSRMLQMLQRNQADLSVGGMRQTVGNSFLATSTHNYHQTSVRFGVLGITYELSSLDIMLYPYPTAMWLAIVLVIALSLLVCFILDHLLHLKDQCSNWLNVELIFVGMPMVHIPRSIAKRVYCVMLMFYTLLIRTSYQGMLYHLIRTHLLNRLPQTIDELVAHNYTVVVSAGVHDMLIDIPAVQNMRFRVVDVDESLLKPLQYVAARPYDKRQVAASVLEIFLMNNRLNAFSAEAQVHGRAVNHFELIAQDVINLQLTMYLRKHSFLIDAFNDEIMWLRSVGLLAIWTRWELDKNQLRSTQTNFRILDIQELYVVFLLLLLGLLLSMIIFCLELLSLRSARLQRWFITK